MVRREMDKLVEELEKRAKNVELPEEAVEYCKKKDEEFLAGLARLEIPSFKCFGKWKGNERGDGPGMIEKLLNYGNQFVSERMTSNSMLSRLLATSKILKKVQKPLRGSTMQYGHFW